MFDQTSINKLLAQKEPSEFEKKLKTELMAYLKSSSEKMSEQWPKWENAQRVYRGLKIVDRDDEKSAAKGEPTKILIPVTFAQIQTATAFIHSAFMQKDRLFELSGTGSEDVAVSDALETDLQYQVNKTKLSLKLYLFILDILKFGTGVLKISWEEQKALMRVGQTVNDTSFVDGIKSIFGLAYEPKTRLVESVQSVLKYQGNVVTNISPFCFFPDPSLPIARFQEGGFVAHEELVNKDKLAEGEGSIYFGTKHIKELRSDIPEMAERERWFNREFKSESVETGAAKINRDSVLFTEVQFSITPKEWTEKFGIDFGDETTPVKHVAVIANDSKIIRFERLNYLHGEYTYVVAEYVPDHNNFSNAGLADSINELQALMTWFFNSHVANVKKIVSNQVVADPSKVYTEDIVNRETVIRLKSGPSVTPDGAVKQLQVVDATRGHVGDAQNIFTLIQNVTGVNDNALGNYAPGRRSAFEARQVSAGAAMRLKMHASLIWNSGLEPLAQQLLANTRQNRSQPVYEKIVGPAKAQNAPFDKTILVDPDSLAGGYDFIPYDGTLPSEKNSHAQLLNELLTTCLSNPQAAQMLNVDIRKLLARIGELTGIRDLDNISQNPMAAANAVAGQQPPQVQVVPDEIAEQAAAGGATPVDLGGESLIRAFAGQ